MFGIFRINCIYLSMRSVGDKMKIPVEVIGFRQINVCSDWSVWAHDHTGQTEPDLLLNCHPKEEPR